MSIQLTAAFTAAAVLEGAIDQVLDRLYIADAWFQRRIVPVVQAAAVAVLTQFIRSLYYCYLAGQGAAVWYARYNAASVPAVSTVDTVEPQLALSGAAPMLLLPAETEFHAGRAAAEERVLRQCCKTLLISAPDALPGVEVLITPPAADAVPVAPKPATKRRKPLNSATTPEVARKNATKVAGPRGKKVSID